MNTPVSPNPLTHVPGAERGVPLRLTNARLVLPDRVMEGTITVEDGVIVEIASGSASGTDVIDCGGAYVLPGLVELHTDNLERHIEPRPSVAWPHLPAILAHDAELASTGITTVFDALRVGSIHHEDKGYAKYAREVSREIIAARAEGLLKISHFLHLRAETCSETLIEELDEFSADDRIGIVSLMDHTPGQRQFRDVSKLKAYVAKKRGMSDAGFAEHVANLTALRARLGEAHDRAAVAAAGRLGAVIASHDDTTADHVAESRAKGAVFAEFPTTVEAASACRKAGIAIMMGAPNVIRGGSHSGNVAAADLAKLDLLDILSSDYVPSALLLSAFRLAESWGDLPRAVRTVTEAPARSSGLSDRGALREGLRGDLVCVTARGDLPVVRAVWSRGRQIA